jgi:hypothetical protein
MFCTSPAESKFSYPTFNIEMVKSVVSTLLGLYGDNFDLLRCEYMS